MKKQCNVSSFICSIFFANIFEKPGFFLCIPVPPLCSIPIAIPMYTDLFTCRNNIKRKRCLFHAWQKENATTFLVYNGRFFVTFSFLAGNAGEIDENVQKYNMYEICVYLKKCFDKKGQKLSKMLL